MDIIGVVLDKLVPVVEEEVDLHLNADEKAQTLADSLKDIQELLDDAERRQLGNSSIKKWLEKVQDLAYDIEDALDDWKLANRQKEEKDKQKIRGKVCFCLQLPCIVAKRRRLVLDIKGLTERVKNIYHEGMDKELKKKNILGNYGTSSRYEGSSSDLEWRKTTSYGTSDMVGRDTDARNIKKMLFSDTAADGKDHPEVVCILGVGGMGKTTLAQKVYNDKEVENEFPVRIWVCVSDPFEPFKMSKEIYEQLERHSPNLSSLEALYREIEESLLGKSSKFLIVLDDVWTEDSRMWKPLQSCLRHGAEGSKILVTTRKDKTAEAMGACKSTIYRLKELTDQQCWLIIRQTVALSGNEWNYRGLEEAGVEIAKKCDGSPLAASFLGGHLKDKKQVQEWEWVLESEIWKLENVEERLFRHFFLSYNELEPAAKRCFLYCALFPKDFEYRTKDLIRQWMAQGYLSSSPPISISQMEAKGYGYFNVLAQKSFFRIETYENLVASMYFCKMHDIVHDFAMYLSRTELPRHLRWPPCEEDRIASATTSNSASKLRSLLYSNSTLPIDDLVGRLKRVRMLIVVDCGLTKIPEEIGNLINLRYLDLSKNNMEELPEAVCNLCNLQTLVLDDCSSLTRFPKGISNLRNLRYLIYLHSDIEFPPEIAILTNLQMLTSLTVKRGFNDLKYMRDWNQLRGKLIIKLREVDDEEDVEAAKTASLWQKTSIDELILDYDEGVRLQVVEALQPHPQLPSLSIYTQGLRFPTWIAALRNLRKLFIYVYDEAAPSNGSSLPHLWELPSLEHLVVMGHSWVMKQLVGNGFYGLVSTAAVNNYIVTDDDTNAATNNQLSSDHVAAFPKLETLILICHDDEFTDWSDMTEEQEATIRSSNITIMPRLTELGIHICPELETLPHRALQQLPSLETLRIVECPELEKKYGDGRWTPKFDVIFKEESRV